MFSWGDLGALCQDDARSLVKGNCAVGDAARLHALLGREQSRGSSRAEPNRVGNTTGGSWHGVVSGSANQEAAYSFLSLMAIQPVSLWAVQHGWTGINPGFTLPDAAARRRRRGWPTTSRPAGTAPTSRTISPLSHATFNAPTMLPYLRIRGTAEYWSVLDRELAAAMGGRKTAKEALDATAAAWEGITDRLGREQQLERTGRHRLHAGTRRFRLSRVTARRSSNLKRSCVSPPAGPQPKD